MDSFGHGTYMHKMMVTPHIQFLTHKWALGCSTRSQNHQTTVVTVNTVCRRPSWANLHEWVMWVAHGHTSNLCMHPRCLGYHRFACLADLQPPADLAAKMWVSLPSGVLLAHTWT